MGFRCLKFLKKILDKLLKRVILQIHSNQGGKHE
jgi:hypothetical protein